ncbi:hypothetical protein GCM10011414_25970 [Croceivirga lutea]|uniref:capsule assembly Wzi family protein n=1 Tax=Croceivirga lutea TaxID=1775167 RepID=UPI00163A7B4E|nr:capsule assembly Wzi family protein [Croceivirga lutea]GGG54933.1 hypothetical protein GCM10011414_25970 [Croceivirga lutea]
MQKFKTRKKLETIPLRTYNLFILVFLFGMGLSSAQYRHRGSFEQSAIAAKLQNPFWTAANTLGQRSNDTDALSILQYNYNQFLTEGRFLKVGISSFIDFDSQQQLIPRFSTYFAQLDWDEVSIAAGARPRKEKYLGLSSTNGDILWSNNARPMPGLEIFTSKPIYLNTWFGVSGGFANYWHTDDRFVDGAMVHHKNLEFTFKLNPNARLTLGAHHYAQWGGTSESQGNLPGGLGAFTDVLFIKNGEGTVLAPGEERTGNHLGSYRIAYHQQLKGSAFDVYYQSLFEDSSGREGHTFPDGLWGVFWQLPSKSVLKGVLYEYVQTNWQSGVRPERGHDDYFNSTVYQSGWTHYGRTIGIPFIRPNADGVGIANNMVKAHHFGVMGESGGLQLRAMASFATNEGLSRERFVDTQKVAYLQLGGTYHWNTNLKLHLTTAGDFDGMNFSNTYAVLGGITYKIAKRHRYYTGYLDFEPEYD